MKHTLLYRKINMLFEIIYYEETSCNPPVIREAKKSNQIILFLKTFLQCKQKYFKTNNSRKTKNKKTKQNKNFTLNDFLN
jgi:hypothetical protein